MEVSVNLTIHAKGKQGCPFELTRDDWDQFSKTFFATNCAKVNKLVQFF